MLNIDLAIIGGGIAGISSAIYAKRAGLDFFLFEPKSIGGQLLFIENVDNFAGTKIGTKGSILAQILKKNLAELDIKPKDEEVIKVESVSQEIILYTKNSRYKTKGLIIATGASFKKLGIKGEDEFCGKGVSYCAVCDGFFFKNKVVAVVGGGNTAIEEALYLSRLAKRIYLIHRRDSLRGLDYLQKELKSRSNIEIIFSHNLKEIRGKERLTEVVLENAKTGKLSTQALDGLFIAIGIKPNTEIFKNIVKTDEDGFITSDEYMRTSSEFIWACGDCRKRPLRQLITAASEGAIASLSAYRYLRGYYISA